MPTTQPRRDSVPNCRVGITRSGRSKAPVMISIRSPSIRPKLSGVPQAAQKPRSAMEDERKNDGFPLVQAKSVLLMSAKEANGAPLAFWHIRQWQIETLFGAVVTPKRTAPHWQPPVKTGLLASVMPAPSVDRRLAMSQARRRRRRQN